MDKWSEVETLNTTKDTRLLYAVAVEQFHPRRGWSAEVEYLHAESQADAQFRFRAANTEEILKGWIKIVGIAPAIGIHAAEDTGLFI